MYFLLLDELLYWSDSRNGRVYSCTIENPDECDTIFDDPSTHLKDIATDGEYLYIADYNRE